jgi:Tfp pilus assembly protein PilE
MMKREGQKGFILPGVEGLIMIGGLMVSVALLSLNSARMKSRDAKRMADVRQMASALELYYNDKTSYPNSLKDLTPNYIGVIPTPPQPPDGTCTQEQNEYSYKKTATDKYRLTFCLGAVTQGFSEGARTLTQVGIE